MSARRLPRKENRSALVYLVPSTSTWSRIFSSTIYKSDSLPQSRGRARCRRRGHWCAPFSPHTPRPRGPATACRVARDLTPCASARATQLPSSTGSSSTGARYSSLELAAACVSALNGRWRVQWPGRALGSVSQHVSAPVVVACFVVRALVGRRARTMHDPHGSNVRLRLRFDHFRCN